jgi:hypothetical protein
MVFKIKLPAANLLPKEDDKYSSYSKIFIEANSIDSAIEKTKELLGSKFIAILSVKAIRNSIVL